MDGQARRSAATRAKLIASARQAFAETGFHEAATPAIAKAAGVSRGALYHQFADKTALFLAVVEAMQAELFAAIETATASLDDPVEALKQGSRAFVEGAARADFVRIVMIDAPSVIGFGEWRRLDRQYGTASLRAGLRAAMEAGVIRRLPLDGLTALLSGAMNEGVLHLIDQGGDADARAGLTEAIEGLIDGLRADREV